MKKLMATVGVLALLAGNSFAQEKIAKTHKQDESKKKGDKLMDDIPNLTEAQKTKIQAIRDEAKKKSEPQRKEKKELKAKLKELKTAPNPNQAEINKLIDRSATVKAELAKAKTAKDVEIRNVLTPEQRKVMYAKLKEKGDKKSSKQK
jgi:Spy/CpxP family protein refolding chaperone